MSQYYLMSQLPSLDGVDETMQMPITEEWFYELCNQFLSKKMIEYLHTVTLIPSREEEATGIPLIDAWNRHERQLRLALAHIRAEKMEKNDETGFKTFPIQVLQAVQTATEMDHPLEAEQYLNRFRIGFLETLRPMDFFTDDAVFYYALKLKLLARMKQFDESSGRVAYQTIYNSIMSGEMMEAIQ